MIRLVMQGIIHKVFYFTSSIQFKNICKRVDFILQ